MKSSTSKSVLYILPLLLLSLFATKSASALELTRQFKILPQPIYNATNDLAGHSVALSGTNILMGANGDNDNGSGAGAAWRYIDLGYGASLGKFKPSDGAAEDAFGWAVDIAGNYSVAGSHGDDDSGLMSGSAYIFNTGVSPIVQTVKLTPTTPAEAFDQFGYAVAINTNHVIIGAIGDDDKGSNAGAVYLYEVPYGVPAGKWTASDGEAFDNFGRSVALSDSFIAVIGADGDDDNGNYAGAAYVFDQLTDSQRYKLKPADGSAGSQFGYAVATEGNLAVVGARGDDVAGTDSGSAYIFNVVTGQELVKLVPSDGAAYDYFGSSVAIAGNIVAVGAYGYGNDEGAVYFFNAATGAQLKKLIPTDAEDGAQFGVSVAGEGNRFVVGAWQRDDYGFNSGAAYVYDAQLGCNTVLDFDGDGISDLAIYQESAGAWNFQKSTDGSATGSLGFPGAVPVAGDFDGDGLCDYGVYYATAGSWHLQRSFSGGQLHYFGQADTLPVVGDFDGNGQTDYGYYYPPTGDWNISLNGATVWNTQFGYEGTTPITGDFDGDGAGDFGCFYPPNGNWYVYQSTEGFWTTLFGYTGCVPVTGDFDGDGIGDFGCYYASEGWWYLYKSTEGFWTTQFGYSGTTPVTGDYDGDCIDDFGCYDPNTGNWFIYKSADGFYTTQFGYSGTVNVRP